MRDNNLNSLVYFEAVARRGAVALAAEELRVSASAVSQQIKTLELQLGIKLFRRSGRRLILTLQGEELYSAASTSLGIVKNALSGLSQNREHSKLNLRVAPSFGVRWLAPRLHEFIETNPNIDVRIDAAPDATDFDREIMDLDIRYGAGPWHGLAMTPLIQDYVIPMCSPAYLDKMGDSNFEEARYITSARALCQWDYWFVANNISHSDPAHRYVLDRSSMAIQLAMDGAGVVLESLALAQNAIDDGRLVPFSTTYPAMRFGSYWIVCPERHLKRKSVTAFVNWIREKSDVYDDEVKHRLAQIGIKYTQIDARDFRPQA